QLLFAGPDHFQEEGDLTLHFVESAAHAVTVANCRSVRARSARSNSSKATSPATVIFGLGAALSTRRTGWPISSQAAVSSVTSKPLWRTTPRARRMISVRKHCGV